MQNNFNQRYANVPPTVTTSDVPVIERVENAPTIHQKIIPTERTEVQSFIHRDREQTEVHKVLQPMRQTEVHPTQVKSVELPAQTIQTGAINSGYVRDNLPVVQPEVIVAPVTSTRLEKAPIVEETVHKKIIQEVQPVLYKETIKPTIVETTQPIYEKIHEAPQFFEEVRSLRDLGTTNLQGSSFGQNQEFQREGGIPRSYGQNSLSSEFQNMSVREEASLPNSQSWNQGQFNQRPQVPLSTGPAVAAPVLPATTSIPMNAPVMSSGGAPVVAPFTTPTSLNGLPAVVGVPAHEETVVKEKHGDPLKREEVVKTTTYNPLNPHEKLVDKVKTKVNKLTHRETVKETAETKNYGITTDKQTLEGYGGVAPKEHHEKKGFHLFGRKDKAADTQNSVDRV